MAMTAEEMKEAIGATSFYILDCNADGDPFTVEEALKDIRQGNPNANEWEVLQILTRGCLEALGTRNYFAEAEAARKAWEEADARRHQQPGNQHHE
jgi:hypothetical protein